jgi:hypothetical protein
MQLGLAFLSHQLRAVPQTGPSFAKKNQLSLKGNEQTAA